MYARTLLVLSLVTFMAACSSTDNRKTQIGPIGSLTAAQKRAAQFNSVVTVPVFETSPEAVQSLVKNTIATGNATLDEIGKLDHQKVTFDSTVRSLDDLSHFVGTAANRLNFLKETSPNTALRDAATEAIKILQEWSVGTEYREDVYLTVKACSAPHSHSVRFL